MEVILVRDLRKSYGPVKALRGISFSVPRGSIFTVIGPNGAGKTTLLKILTGILKRDRGEVFVLGEDPRKNKEIMRRVAYIPDSTDRLYEDMTVADLVAYYAIMRDIDSKNAKSIAEDLGLDEYRNVRFSALSRGNKQKVFLLLALLTNPEVILADEPTSMLDLATREFILSKLVSISREGVTVFFSSHILQEVETVADYVIVIDAGKKVFEGSVDELYRLYESNTYEVVVNEPSKLAKRLKEEGFHVELSGGRLFVTHDKPKELRLIVPKIVSELGLELFRFVPVYGGFRAVIREDSRS